MEETREVNLRLCRAFVECDGGKAMTCVASVLRHQRMMSLTMEFMVSLITAYVQGGPTELYSGN